MTKLEKKVLKNYKKFMESMRELTLKEGISYNSNWILRGENGNQAELGKEMRKA